MNCSYCLTCSHCFPLSQRHILTYTEKYNVTNQKYMLIHKRIPYIWQYMQKYCDFDFTDIIYYLKCILDAFLDIFQDNCCFLKDSNCGNWLQYTLSWSWDVALWFPALTLKVYPHVMFDFPLPVLACFPALFYWLCCVPLVTPCVLSLCFHLTLNS